MQTPPIPRQPIGITFIVAVNVLGLCLILQFIAVAWYFLPLLRQQVIESATVARVQPAAEPSTGSLPGNPTTDSAQSDPAFAQRINRLVADSDAAYRVGDFDAAFKQISEAGDLLPNDPGILLRRALLLESMQQPAEALSIYAHLATLPTLSAELRPQVEKKLARLGGAATAKGPVTSEFETGQSGTAVRDEIGLQPGSDLGIVDTRMRDGVSGTKVLRVAIKSRPGTKVDRGRMKLIVFFYEKDETGEIQLTESKVAYQWISPPIDWADNEPELLDVSYVLPESSESAAANGSSGRKFVGYVVGVYYKGALQDTQAEPGSLAKKFPLDLFEKRDSE